MIDRVRLDSHKLIPIRISFNDVIQKKRLVCAVQLNVTLYTFIYPSILLYIYSIPYLFKPPSITDPGCSLPLYSLTSAKASLNTSHSFWGKAKHWQGWSWRVVEIIQYFCLISQSFVLQKLSERVEGSEGFVQQEGYSKVDVEKVDLKEFPQFQHISWWSARMEKGDCLYIPFR